MNNKEIKAEIKYLLSKEGKTLKWLSEELELSNPQSLNQIFNSKSLTIEKVNWLLKPIGYKLEINFVKEDKQC